MIILGIDPGSAIIGYAIINKSDKKILSVVDFGCIMTDKFMSSGEKLKKNYKEILKLIEKYRPDLVSIESLYFFKNLKTIIPVSQTKGVILLACAQKNIPITEFTPLQVKMAVCGYGRAEKKQVQEMMKKILDLDNFDFKQKNRKKDDAFDALGVAVCASFKVF
jgi:crossover junction endodeoxyribonuclease RuvC